MHTSPYPNAAQQGGFTLVEMVMALVIIAIVAVGSSLFLRPAVNAYFAVEGRAEITDQTDRALRTMAREIRLAVPNSIRSPNNQCFEMIPTLSGGIYRAAADTVNDSPAGCTTPSATCSAPLDTNRATTVFDVLTALPATPAIGDWIVIGNQNTNDVYAGADRSQITAVGTPRTSDGMYRVSVNPIQFPIGYDGYRFVIAPNSEQAVFYVCSGADGTVDANGDGKGVLYRMRSYGFNASYPGSCPATTGGDVVATKIKNCNFIYSPDQGNTQQNAFVSLQMTLSKNNEAVTLVHGAHIDNVP